MRFRPRQLKETADASRGGREGWRSRLKGIVSAVAVLGAFYLVLGVVAEFAAGYIPARWEAEWFAWAPEAFELEDAGDDELQNLFARLLEDEGLLDFPYRLYVMPDPAPNAFAMPGGTVAVTTGLLDMVESETGRALVLAHELGHLQFRHGLKRLGRLLLLQGAMAAAGLDSNSLVKSGFQLADLEHSRDQESACDRFGLELVHRRLGTTEGALEFFEKVQEWEGDGAMVRMTSFLQTHPLSSDRVEELRAHSAELEAGV